MKKKKGLYILLVLSLALSFIVLAAGHRQEREQDAETAAYRSMHSLFEDIVFCGPGVPAVAIFSGRGESPSKEVSGPEEGSITSTAGTKSVTASGAAAAVEEFVLYRTGENKWSAYVPSDLSDRVYVHFRYLESLELTAEEEAEKLADGYPGKITLRDGSLLYWSELAASIGESAAPASGVVLRASAEGADGSREEAEITFFFAEQVPTLYLTTETGSLEAINEDKSVREEGRYVFYTADGEKDVSGKMKIHGRGNSSWKEDKKQYSLNLGSSRKVLGMSDASKFALIANTSDDSNMRNKAMFDLAAMCGMPSTPESAFVNVYVNGSYNGLYLLAQRANARGGSVRISDLEASNAAVAGREREEVPEAEAALDSLEIQKKEDGSVSVTDAEGLELHAASDAAVPDNITGGYLLEMDGRYEDEKYWFSTQRHHFVVKYPDEIPLAEEMYIAGCLREAEKSFYSADGINPDTGKSWEKYLDTDSWARMYLLQDFLVQWDVESFSFFVYKEADDPLLYCGPVWDFDLSMGATGLGRLPNITRYSMWLRDHREGWLTQLMKHGAFSDRLYKDAAPRFFEVLESYLAGDPETVLSADSSQSTAGEAVSEDLSEDRPGLLAQAEALRTSAAMDCDRWGENNEFAESVDSLFAWLRDRSRFWQDYAEDPDAFCTVTFRYGFADMDIYVRRGEAIGFVPTEEYGEHLYGSFRRKYGEVDGWKAENGEVLTAETVITRDCVFLPFEK